MYIFWDNKQKKYQNISYDEIIKRYYRDQQLKQAVFQAIGDIEASLNTTIAHVLGKKSPTAYLNFSSWCQTDGYNKEWKRKYKRRRNGEKYNVDKFIIKREELFFLQKVQSKVEHSSLRDIKEFESSGSKVFPSIWLITNTLTFGESIYLLKLMSKSNKLAVANIFHKPVKDLIKWLEMLNLVRNICCHNGNLVDISLLTMPPIPKKYNKFLDINNDNVPHKISIVICVILELLREINPKYDVKKSIVPILNKLGAIDRQDNNSIAQNMGFKNFNAISRLCFSFYNEPTTIYKPDGSFINC